MTIEYSPDFLGYCRTLSDRQLENVLAKEYEASRESESRLPDYEAAKIEADRRGWTVIKGQRV